MNTLSRPPWGHPFLLLLFLLTAGIPTGLPAPSAWGATRRKGPYLLLAGDPTAMTLCWQLDGKATCLLEWGTDPGYGSGSVQTTEYGPDHQHAYTITGLAPQTLYYYRVTMDTVPYTGTFRTPPDSSSTHVTFLAYGDTRTYPSVHDQVAQAMLQEMSLDPDCRTFLPVVGDLVEHGREEPDWDQQFFDAAYTHIQALLANAPYQSCVGNHDLSGSGGDLFLKYFPYPWVVPHYGSFDYGPVHFAYVDQYQDYTPGSPQYDWLVGDLSATDRPWRMVVLHEPGWSAGGHSNNTGVQIHLQPLFEIYGVTLVLCGHNHYYARAVTNGIQHITTGGGGAPLYDPNPGAPHVVVASKSHHYCRIEVNGNRLTFKAVKTDGTVIDAFTLVQGDLFVDGDNVNGPWDGTKEHPFRKIQEALDVAAPHATVFVAPGRYVENVDFAGKAVHLVSMEGAGLTVIDGNGTGNPVAFVTGEGPDAMLEGFTLTNGHGTNGGGISCDATARPTVLNCVITGNEAVSMGGGIYGGGAITNCTIYGNHAAFGGGAASTSPETVITNCIVWGNTATLAPQIFGIPTVTYSDVEGGWNGTGNLASDPLFTGAPDGDFHLRHGSPCREAGTAGAPHLPALDFEGDPRIAGNQPDMGADEFYPHLYFTGQAVPGGAVTLHLVGAPGTVPVALAVGSGVLDPPWPSPWGDWFLAFPIVGPFYLAPIPSSGVEDLPGTLPPSPPGPYEIPFQCLLGTKLSNLALLEVL